ncbi:conjugal transfer protein TraN [uncultured Erythrobacter sp.]|uniref:conjugal transfer protein TraN n=1 Tax=uncultured Erythrobacter sp. TaxID=263913 RepID=UPI0026139D8E|nr:conjugal transfer protein TraN [uncultured Erythrobacter sp.]
MIQLQGMKALLLALSLLAVPASAQQQEARSDGKAFGESLRGEAQAASKSEPNASELPNFDRNAVRNLERLADNPDQIEGTATAASRTHQGHRLVRDSMANRARFESDDIEAVIARSLAINKTPLDYTSGMSISGSQGECVPLPPGAGSAGTYTATCNTGTRIEQAQGQCAVPLVASVTQRQQWHYLCNDTGIQQGLPLCSTFNSGLCRITGYRPGPCLQWWDNGFNRYCSEPGDPIAEISCDAPDPRYAPYAITTQSTVDAAPDETQCLPYSEDGDCTLEAEICSDDSPQTRIVDGVAVTQSCWEWERSYTCTSREAASDCSDIEALGTCRFVREECITEEVPCETWERIYECPLPETENSPQFVCDSDVYCIDGSCETIERTPNDEFKDAVTALNAMDEARGQFEPNTLTLFRGTRNTCSSKVFGVLNCCKGKGFPLIPGISLLVALGCDREEVLLHERDAQGLCAYVGTYCSKKFLGVCLTKKKAYCCFESKLSRILQEQGRGQLPKPWDKPKHEQCEGFTLDEFAQLDLSLMDFSEVYAEFTEAARLPDELETSILIQQKIDDYYARGGQ